MQKPSAVRYTSNKASTELVPDSLTDIENPYSLYNLLPTKKLKNALLEAQEAFQGKTFDEITEDMIAHSRAKDKTVIDHIRQAFWHEYDIAVSGKRELSPPRIYEGYCGMVKFTGMMNNVYVASYIFSRPVQTEVKLKAVLDTGFNRLMEVMELPLQDDSGKINVSLIKEIREIYKMADLRLNGGIIQKVHQTSLNVNANQAKLDDYSKLTPEEIDKQLLELQAQQNANQLVINVDTDTSRPIETEATTVTRD